MGASVAIGGGDFDAALLPGRVGIAEPRRHVAHGPEETLLGEGGVVVEQRLRDARWAGLLTAAPQRQSDPSSEQHRQASLNALAKHYRINPKMFPSGKSEHRSPIGGPDRKSCAGGCYRAENEASSARFLGTLCCRSKSIDGRAAMLDPSNSARATAVGLLFASLSYARLLLAILLSAFAAAKGACEESIALGQENATSIARPAQNVFVDDFALPSASAAKGWSVNAWGLPPPRYEISVVSEPMSSQTHFSAAQSFRLIESGGGGAHLIRPFSASYGVTYELHIFLRAESAPARATVSLRYDAPYYDAFGAHTVELTAQWKEVTVRGVYPHDKVTAASVRVESLTPGAAIHVGPARLDRIDRPLLAPVGAGKPVSSEFFGIVVNRLGLHHNWPGLDTQIIRLWDTGTRWLDIEPERDNWKLDRVNLYLSYAERNGAQVLFTLGQTPAWAASDPFDSSGGSTGPAPPENPETWRHYVRDLAQRYGSRINYWELWNEPDYAGFWRGTPEQLAILARIAREEVKRVNPSAWLVGPSITNGVAFLDRFLAAGGGAALDAVSFHGAATPRSKDLLVQIAEVRFVLSSYGLEALPLWNTESAVWCDLQDCAAATEPSGEAADTVAARALFLMAAKGLYGTVFYNWERNMPDALVGLSNPPDYRSLTSAGEAYRQTADLLRGATIEDSLERQGVFIVRFKRADGKKVALWTDERNKIVEIAHSWPYAHYHFLGRTEALASPDSPFALPPGAVLVGE